MSGDDEKGLHPVGAEGSRLKQSLTDAHRKTDAHEGKTERFDPGASMLGTDNEAGAEVDHDGMAEAREAPGPDEAETGGNDGHPLKDASEKYREQPGEATGPAPGDRNAQPGGAEGASE